MGQGIGHYVYPRYTRVMDTRENKKNINEAYTLIGTTLPDGKCFDTQTEQQEHLNALMQRQVRDV